MHHLTEVHLRFLLSWHVGTCALRPVAHGVNVLVVVVQRVLVYDLAQRLYYQSLYTSYISINRWA